MSHIATLFDDIGRSCKILKTKTFISEKSLDTPVFRLIRFRQKVLTEFKPPLELFSLEEEATQLPGGLFAFVFLARSASKLRCTARGNRELFRFFRVSSIERYEH